KFIKYRDHRHTLKILELADRYNCPDLIINCIKELDLQLTSATVLDVLQSLWYYNSVSPFPVPSANESNNSRKKAPNQPFTPEEYMSALLNNSLQLIDMHAELILTKEQMTDLKFQEFEMIAKRDALQLQSESTLYNCLAEWSLEQTKRKQIDPTDENRRRVLGALIYTPRYLTMTARDFEKCLERVELLDSGEIEMVRDALNKGAGNSSRNKKSIQAFNQNLSDEQISLLTKFRTPRPAFARMPIHLSDRSNPKNYPKKMRLHEKEELGEHSGCADTKCGFIFFSFLACLFD
uniref:BACK domain-containing protein n=1 Tax=Megaselia scalaris TaxID=36166 RepID=T1H176_MEGSC